MKQNSEPGMSPPESKSVESRLEAFRSSDVFDDSFAAVDCHDSNEHIALVYESQEEQFAAAIPFIRQGIERDEKCLYVVDDNTKHSLFEALRNDGVDVEAAQEKGLLTFLTEDTYVRNGALTPDEQVTFLAETIENASKEYPAVRVAVEMTCFLDESLEFEDLIAYEQRYNTLSADVDAIALCQYNRDRFPAEVIRDTIHAHPHLITDDTLNQNIYYTPPEEFFDPDQATHEVDRMKAMMSRLAEAESELERQNERLEEFASIVSHDLRNPLRVAEGYLELEQEEHGNEHLDGIARAHDRMDSMIENILALAREGNQVDYFEPVELTSIANDCWHNVPTGEATLVVSTTCTIQASRERLQQLLENLMRNAVEHGGDDVTVTIGALDNERGFYVEDSGPGIPVDQRERVFDSGYSTSKAGTGFGLSIVKEIVRAHDWTIRVTEGTDGGARFELGGLETLS